MQFFYLKNILFIMVVLFIPSTYSQQAPHNSNTDPKANSELKDVVSPPLTIDSAPTTIPEEDADDITKPCDIPPNTDIVHFPIDSWDAGLETIKKVQETVDVVKTGVKDTIKFLENTWDAVIEPSETDNNIKPQENNENQQSSIVVEKAAYSQFALAQLIRQNPNSFIFHEFATHIYDARYLDTMINTAPIEDPDQLPGMEKRTLEHLFNLVNTQFPKGLPAQYTDLDKSQKYTLAIVGGVHTLFFLNELPIIFPTISEMDYQRIFEKYSFTHCSIIHGILNICTSSDYTEQVLRATKLASIVNNFLRAFPNNNKGKHVVILAYGGDHDLQYYFPDKNLHRMPGKCVSKKTE